jgi:hypothetical protein
MLYGDFAGGFLTSGEAEQLQSPTLHEKGSIGFSNTATCAVLRPPLAVAERRRLEGFLGAAMRHLDRFCNCRVAPLL